MLELRYTVYAFHTIWGGGGGWGIQHSRGPQLYEADNNSSCWPHTRILVMGEI